MTALYIILAVLAVIALILLLRIGIIAEYGEEGFTLLALIGPAPLQIVPAKEGKPKKPKKKREKKPAEPKKAEGEAQEKPGALASFQAVWPDIKELLSSLKKGISIDELTLHYVAAGDDPVAVAITYGGVSAAMGMITGFLEQNFNIRKRDYRSGFDFTIHEPRLYVKAQVTMRVWQSLRLGSPILEIIKKTKEMQKRKEEK